MIAAILLAGALSAADAESYRDACTPAAFEALSENYDPSGAMTQTHDRSNRHCFFGGRAEIAEYRGLDENNEPSYHGVSVTIWNADRSRGRTLWAMVGAGGTTNIEQRWEDGVLVAEGRGTDTGGEFVERSRTTFKPGGDSTFTMDRSFDGGKTWIAPFNIIRSLKTPHPPAPLDGEWSEGFAAFAPKLVGENGMVMLDGQAWGRFLLDDGKAPTGFVFASVAPGGEGWVWRTLTWTYAGGLTNTEAVPLQ